MKKDVQPSIVRLLEIMAALRAPTGCPWDREQDHQSIRYHAIEEVYELLDAIETKDDQEMCEELGDLLLQIVFHCQLAVERGSFNFEVVAQTIGDKLIRRHPHVFGESQVTSVEAVWAQWETIKKSEKAGTQHERVSIFDGIPKHLPALLRAEKLSKKARKLGVMATEQEPSALTETDLARRLFELSTFAQAQGWSAEELLREESQRQENLWRELETTRSQAT